MIRAILALPFLLVLVLFALSNEQTIQLRFWPTDYVLAAPLSVAILGASAIAFLIGACLVWFSAAAARLRLARSERTRRDLEEQIRALNARMIQSAMPRATASTPAMSPTGPRAITQAPVMAAPARASNELTVTR